MQCPEPMIGNGKECSNDTDLDGYPDVQLTIGCNNQPVKACPVVSEWERVRSCSSSDIGIHSILQWVEIEFLLTSSAMMKHNL